MYKYFLVSGLAVLLMVSCEQKKQQESLSLFTKMSPEETGIDFTNQLRYDADFNVYTYRNYYNGGGVAIGDVNKDGLVDIYFTSNLDKNKLYLNQGNFQFKDISAAAGVEGSRAWSTGVTMADINGDGLLDIYVCNSGDIEGDNKQNELFINNGDLTFTESAEKYGLADRGFSTHASFFDYDKDGDLDAYMLNNSYQAIGSFNLRRNERPKRDSLGGDKLLRNDNGLFVDVSKEAGVYGSIIGFGLGVTIGDVNGDTWDDIYVSNDFFERDYLYINQGDGTFKEDLTSQMKSISGASMGADLADVNNDGYNDLFVTEMLPSDNERLKSVTTFENWDRYQYNLENGYYHQFTRNTFQLNNGDSTFSEIGRLAGVEASDWSWGALFFDMDNDGLRDLFIANGIYQDLTNQDYLQYISNEEVIKSILSDNKVDYAKLIDLIPSNPIPNHAYKNVGDLRFESSADDFGLGEPSFSNGSAYGDLDNDGDLDLVVNNVNMPSWVFRNNADSITDNHYIKFDVIGMGANTNAIGTKIKVLQDGESYYIEQQPIRGFQSSVDPRPNVGLPKASNVNITVFWPNGGVSKLSDVAVDQTVTLDQNTLPKSESQENQITDQQLFTYQEAPDFKHVENTFIDFDRDRLLYHMNSTEGPKMASGDVNGDGKLDFYIGGAKDQAGTLLITKGVSFVFGSVEVFEQDKLSEDAESVFFDGDNDGDLDLYVCSGGVEFSQSSSALKDRYYINDGKGNFTKSDQFLPASGTYVSSATVAMADVDQDGDIDLFVGERMKPVNYGIPGNGYLLINDGKGNFDSFTPAVFEKMGMITSSRFVDLDGDEDQDLVVAGEFTGVLTYRNDAGEFTQIENSLSGLRGWWRTIETADIDGDGDQDLLVGNHGLNSRFSATDSEPIRLYINDYDKNGFIDPILTGYANDGKEYPYALRHNLIDQIKSLKKRFPDYESYKNAPMDQIFTAEEIAASDILEVNTLETMLFINDGNFQFSAVTLPVAVQISPVFAIKAADFDEDGDMDVILGGNLYAAKPEVGRYDASYGTYLENDGTGQLTVVKSGRGFRIDGEIRDILVDQKTILISRNNDTLVKLSVK
ncbi:VCBS repeat-containing protein [Marinoscillum sp.]|uniref:VCBS repeat-containing protein n=1 Tax=Marinoscillum sp. TaxID=2024838 RepID=UPI003BACF61C